MKKLLLIILLLPLMLHAQTRFYLTQILSPLSPSTNVGWDVTTGNTVYMMIPYYDKGATLTITSGAAGAAAVRKMIFAQFVSQPLLSQTVDGTFTGQIRMAMNNVTGITGEGFVYLRVLHPNNTITEVGTCTTTDLTTTLTNRTLIALSLSSLSIISGDRFVIDVGWNYATGSLTTMTGSTQLRSLPAATDLPVDNTNATAANPWVEFSQNLKFQSQSNGF